jgi:2-polyprenyl-3-methyl-5-hydroxy-6-metoxy-1,4-benzoquinol methylase
MRALDAGTAMGFFSLPLARMVGPSGRVVCVDLQEKMIAKLKARALIAELADRMEFRVCTKDSLGIGDLAQEIDVALAVAVVHEVPDARRFFTEVFQVLKKGGRLYFSEPAGHVTEDAFAGSISLARAVGFQVEETRKVFRSHSALLTK